jgi:hypothetical protein
MEQQCYDNEWIKKYLGKYVLANNAASGIRFALTNNEIQSSKSPQIKNDKKAKLCLSSLTIMINNSKYTC